MDADRWRQEGWPVAVCVAADLKESQTEDTVDVSRSDGEDAQGCP